MSSMAEILGNQLCMESLQTDIQDVQWTINDISSRMGPLDVSSWKFPDKLSWEIDIEQLLEMYSFDEDEKEENQVAHIALYELLIDRLVLLLQGTAVYVHQVQQLGKGGGAGTESSSSSVGPAVKRFWSQLTNLQSLMQQLHSQNKTSTRKVAELEKELKKASSSSSSAADNNSNAAAAARNIAGQSPLSTDVVSSHPREISCDESNKGSQTIETAFVPCEACDVVQKKMREAGDLVIEVCQNQGLPSSLRKYRPTVSHVRWLTYNDVSRWMAEQNKDVQRLCKHIEQMSATISPLKAEVAAFEKETKQAESIAKQCEVELKREKETQAAVKRQYEVKLQEKEKQHELTLADLHRQKEELVRKHTSLATELDQRKTQSTELESRLKEWESKSQQLEKDLQEKAVVVTRLEGVDQENVTLRQQLTDTSTRLEAASKSLAKEQGKNKSAAQHKQQVQAKQESLSERVVELDQENEDLRDQVNTLEEEKQDLQESLQESKQLTRQLEKEKKEQEIIMQSLKEEKRGLEQSIQETEAQILRMEEELREAKERERLIIEYPDLNGPVNPDLHGTGDIAVDMQNQVKANTVRIHVLEEQNQGLQRSITKIISRASGTATTAPTVTTTISSSSSQPPPKNTAPIPLWQTSTLDNNSTRQRSPPRQSRHMPAPSPKPPSSSVPAQKPAPEFFTVGKAANDRNSSSKDQRKPPAGRGGRGGGGGGVGVGGGGGGGGGLMPVNATSIGAYKQIKKSGGRVQPDPNTGLAGTAGVGGGGRRPPSAHSVGSAGAQQRRGSGQDDTTTPMYVCEHCDKMYTKPRDLEIHRSYCTA
ncbi:uncharacterized protein LOC143288046 [Babylonia areolata]|uniref:uncharacterized protein LOC143288046 n=1 Tax=Babylonia areolata TaxID=304850 RepID=UPI003FD209DE